MSHRRRMAGGGGVVHWLPCQPEATPTRSRASTPTSGASSRPDADQCRRPSRCSRWISRRPRRCPSHRSLDCGHAVWPEIAPSPGPGGSRLDRTWHQRPRRGAV